MGLYRIYDIILESNVVLPELTVAESQEASLTFRLLPPADALSSPPDWIQQWLLPDGTPWLSIARVPDGYRMHATGLADLVVAEDGSAIHCTPLDSAPGHALRHLLLDQAVPLALSLRGEHPFHGCTISTPDGMVAFLGESGQGKSTLATSFAQAGFAVLGDDCLLVREESNRVIGVASYGGVRLWPDTVRALFGEGAEHQVATEKQRLVLNGEVTSGRLLTLPLQRVYVLDPRDSRTGDRSVRISPLSTHEAFLELARHGLCLDQLNKTRLKALFDWQGRLASRPIFRRLSFPRDLNLLPTVRDAVIADWADRGVGR